MPSSLVPQHPLVSSMPDGGGTATVEGAQRQICAARGARAGAHDVHPHTGSTMFATAASILAQAVDDTAAGGFNPLPTIIAVTVAVVIIAAGAIYVLMARERARRDHLRDAQRSQQRARQREQDGRPE